jgi:hypothetical protein
MPIWHRVKLQKVLILSRVGYVTRQITSRHIGYREFIVRSLLHLHSLQFYNYCHLQYHTSPAVVTSIHSIQLNSATGLQFTLDTGY